MALLAAPLLYLSSSSLLLFFHNLFLSSLFVSTRPVLHFSFQLDSATSDKNIHLVTKYYYHANPTNTSNVAHNFSNKVINGGITRARKHLIRGKTSKSFKHSSRGEEARLRATESSRGQR